MPPRLLDLYKDPKHPHCKFAGTELLDRQYYYAPLILIMAQKLTDDGIPHKTEFKFTQRYEIHESLRDHLAKFNVQVPE